MWTDSILDDHRAAKLAAERRTAAFISEKAHELRMVNRAADLRAQLADLNTKEAAFDVKADLRAAELAEGTM